MDEVDRIMDNMADEAQSVYQYHYPTHSQHPQHGNPEQADVPPQTDDPKEDDLLTAVLSVRLKMEAGLWQLVMNSISPNRNK